MARLARQVGRVVAAVALTAAAYAAVPAAPAVAGGCPTADGVTVVVDFHELGGGVQTACVPDGGGDKASSLFPAAGFGLDYVQRQPGFVCRVAGKPADNPCVNTPPADAYWGLWWSDGKSGRWTYATSGVGGQTVPDGGSVAFSWNGSEDSSPPGTTPSAHASSSPTQQPTSQPTKQPDGQPTTQPSGQPGSSQQSSASASASPSAGEGASESASPGAKRGAGKQKERQRSESPSADPTASPSASETEATVVPTSADPPDPDGGGLPAWVAPVVVLVLFGAAGAVAVVRRRTSGPA